MGRLYSGNLMAFKDAIARLKEDYDANVVVEPYRYETLRVILRDGLMMTTKCFEQSDEDVRCNAQTEWLRKVHADLKHWK